jgi:hypothetical protein
MSTSSAQPGPARSVSRTDFMIMATGILMFFLSFAPWEGINAPVSDNLGLGSIPVGPSLTVNAWKAEFSAWLPCLVCLAMALGLAAHDFARAEVPGIAGNRPRWLLRIVSILSFALLTIRLTTLASQHDPDVGQARWGVFIAFIVAAVQLVYIFARANQIGVPPAQPAGSPSGLRRVP